MAWCLDSSFSWRETLKSSTSGFLIYFYWPVKTVLSTAFAKTTKAVSGELGGRLTALEKRCDFAQFNFDGLCQIAKDILPYLEECFEVGDPQRIYELFDDEYSSYIRYKQNGKITTTLRQRIQFDIELLMGRNGRDKYLKSIYGDF